MTLEDDVKQLQTERRIDNELLVQLIKDMTKLENDRRDDKTELALIKQANADLMAKNNELANKLNELDQHMRRNTLRVYGLPKIFNETRALLEQQFRHYMISIGIRPAEAQSTFFVCSLVKLILFCVYV